MQYGLEKGEPGSKHIKWAIFSQEREVLTLLWEVQVISPGQYIQAVELYLREGFNNLYDNH